MTGLTFASPARILSEEQPLLQAANNLLSCRLSSAVNVWCIGQSISMTLEPSSSASSDRAIASIEGAFTTPRFPPLRRQKRKSFNSFISKLSIVPLCLLTHGPARGLNICLMEMTARKSPREKAVRQVAYYPPGLHKMLRLKAARDHRTKTAILIEALQDYFKPIARRRGLNGNEAES
jgi:hypothetical protein